MTRTMPDYARSILNHKVGEQHFDLARFFPSPDLHFFVERYWVIHWDLRGQEPYIQETLPYPCVNIVIEQERSGIFGIATGKFARQLEGRGRVFGIKFRPGAFYPFAQYPISNLTNNAVSIDDVFGEGGRVLEETVLMLMNTDEMVAVVEDFLQEHLPAPDPNITLINQIVDCIVDDRAIRKVEDIVERFHLSKRTLQRLFNQYVGVSPKWVIQRYRLHEATEQLDKGYVIDWARLATDLGYFDQAHFIKDFKAMVGMTPAEYMDMVSV